MRCANCPMMHLPICAGAINSSLCPANLGDQPQGRLLQQSIWLSSTQADWPANPPEGFVDDRLQSPVVAELAMPARETRRGKPVMRLGERQRPCCG